MGGLWLLLRHYLSFITDLNPYQAGSFQTPDPTDWLRGSFLCTYKTEDMKFLGYSIPLANAGFFVPSWSVHTFLMYVPFIILCENWYHTLQGLLMYLCGPYAVAVLAAQNGGAAVLEQTSFWSLQNLVLLVYALIDLRCDASNVREYHDTNMQKSNDLGFEYIRAENGLVLRRCLCFQRCEYCDEVNARQLRWFRDSVARAGKVEGKEGCPSTKAEGKRE